MILSEGVTDKRSIDTFKTLEQRFIELYGNDRFDYSESIYISAKTKMKIKCNICGNTLYKTPDAHLNKNNKGCTYCSNKYKPTLEEFKDKAISIHGDKYDYSNFMYTSKDVPSIIKCNTCGYIFNQSPHNHTYHKKGCLRCARLELHKKYFDIPTLLYYVEFNFEGAIYYKIGITTKDIKHRFSRDMPYFSKLVLSKEFSNGEDAFNIEQDILLKFKEFKAENMSFLQGGNSELFTTDILENIKDYFKEG